MSTHEISNSWNLLWHGLERAERYLLFTVYKERIAGFQVKSVDTTGAGDSFWGGFLSAYLEFRKPVEELSWEEIKYCAEYGNATAALCVQKRGGIPAIPKKEEVSRMIRR